MDSGPRWTSVAASTTATLKRQQAPVSSYERRLASRSSNLRPQVERGQQEQSVTLRTNGSRRATAIKQQQRTATSGLVVSAERIGAQVDRDFEISREFAPASQMMATAAAAAAAAAAATVSEFGEKSVGVSSSSGGGSLSSAASSSGCSSSFGSPTSSSASPSAKGQSAGGELGESLALQPPEATAAASSFEAHDDYLEVNELLYLRSRDRLGTPGSRAPSLVSKASVTCDCRRTGAVAAAAAAVTTTATTSTITALTRQLAVASGLGGRDCEANSANARREETRDIRTTAATAVPIGAACHSEMSEFCALTLRKSLLLRSRPSAPVSASMDAQAATSEAQDDASEYKGGQRRHARANPTATAEMTVRRSSSSTLKKAKATGAPSSARAWPTNSEATTQAVSTSANATDATNCYDCSYYCRCCCYYGDCNDIAGSGTGVGSTGAVSTDCLSESSDIFAHSSATMAALAAKAGWHLHRATLAGRPNRSNLHKQRPVNGAGQGCCTRAGPTTPTGTTQGRHLNQLLRLEGSPPLAAGSGGGCGNRSRSEHSSQLTSNAGIRCCRPVSTSSGNVSGAVNSPIAIGCTALHASSGHADGLSFRRQRQQHQVRRPLPVPPPVVPLLKEMAFLESAKQSEASASNSLQLHLSSPSRSPSKALAADEGTSGGNSNSSGGLTTTTTAAAAAGANGLRLDHLRSAQNRQAMSLSAAAASTIVETTKIAATTILNDRRASGATSIELEEPARRMGATATLTGRATDRNVANPWSSLEAAAATSFCDMSGTQNLLRRRSFAQSSMLIERPSSNSNKSLGSRLLGRRTGRLFERLKRSFGGQTSKHTYAPNNVVADGLDDDDDDDDHDGIEATLAASSNSFNDSHDGQWRHSFGGRARDQRAGQGAAATQGSVESGLEALASGNSGAIVVAIDCCDPNGELKSSATEREKPGASRAEVREQADSIYDTPEYDGRQQRQQRWPKRKGAASKGTATKTEAADAVLHGAAKGRAQSLGLREARRPNLPPPPPPPLPNFRQDSIGSGSGSCGECPRALGADSATRALRTTRGQVAQALKRDCVGDSSLAALRSCEQRTASAPLSFSQRSLRSGGSPNGHPTGSTLDSERQEPRRTKQLGSKSVETRTSDNRDTCGGGDAKQQQQQQQQQEKSLEGRCRVLAPTAPAEQQQPQKARKAVKWAEDQCEQSEEQWLSSVDCRKSRERSSADGIGREGSKSRTSATSEELKSVKKEEEGCGTDRQQGEEATAVATRLEQQQQQLSGYKSKSKKENEKEQRQQRHNKEKTPADGTELSQESKVLDSEKKGSSELLVDFLLTKSSLDQANRRSETESLIHSQVKMGASHSSSAPSSPSKGTAAAIKIETKACGGAPAKQVNSNAPSKALHPKASAPLTATFGKQEREVNAATTAASTATATVCASIAANERPIKSSLSIITDKLVGNHLTNTKNGKTSPNEIATIAADSSNGALAGSLTSGFSLAGKARHLNPFHRHHHPQQQNHHRQSRYSLTGSYSAKGRRTQNKSSGKLLEGRQSSSTSMELASSCSSGSGNDKLHLEEMLEKRRKSIQNSGVFIYPSQYKDLNECHKCSRDNRICDCSNNFDTTAQPPSSETRARCTEDASNTGKEDEQVMPANKTRTTITFLPFKAPQLQLMSSASGESAAIVETKTAIRSEEFSFFSSQPSELLGVAVVATNASTGDSLRKGNSPRAESSTSKRSTVTATGGKSSLVQKMDEFAGAITDHSNPNYCDSEHSSVAAAAAAGASASVGALATQPRQQFETFCKISGASIDQRSNQVRLSAPKVLVPEQEFEQRQPLGLSQPQTIAVGVNGLLFSEAVDLYRDKLSESASGMKGRESVLPYGCLDHGDDDDDDELDANDVLSLPPGGARYSEKKTQQFAACSINTIAAASADDGELGADGATKGRYFEPASIVADQGSQLGNLELLSTSKNVSILGKLSHHVVIINNSNNNSNNAQEKHIGKRKQITKQTVDADASIPIESLGRAPLNSFNCFDSSCSSIEQSRGLTVDSNNNNANDSSSKRQTSESNANAVITCNEDDGIEEQLTCNLGVGNSIEITRSSVRIGGCQVLSSHHISNNNISSEGCGNINFGQTSNLAMSTSDDKTHTSIVPIETLQRRRRNLTTTKSTSSRQAIAHDSDGEREGDDGSENGSIVTAHRITRLGEHRISMKNIDDSSLIPRNHQNDVLEYSPILTSVRDYIKNVNTELQVQTSTGTVVATQPPVVGTGADLLASAITTGSETITHPGASPLVLAQEDHIHHHHNQETTSNGKFADSHHQLMTKSTVSSVGGNSTVANYSTLANATASATMKVHMGDLSLGDSSSPKKSIFEGASKDEILEYLEDARERVPGILMAADDVMVISENELIVVNQLDPCSPATPISIVEAGQAASPVLEATTTSLQVGGVAAAAIVTATGIGGNIGSPLRTSSNAERPKLSSIDDQRLEQFYQSGSHLASARSQFSSQNNTVDENTSICNILDPISATAMTTTMTTTTASGFNSSKLESNDCVIESNSAASTAAAGSMNHHLNVGRASSDNRKSLACITDNTTLDSFDDQATGIDLDSFNGNSRSSITREQQFRKQSVKTTQSSQSNTSAAEISSIGSGISANANAAPCNSDNTGAIEDGIGSLDFKQQPIVYTGRRNSLSDGASQLARNCTLQMMIFEHRFMTRESLSSTSSSSSPPSSTSPSSSNSSNQTSGNCSAASTFYASSSLSCSSPLLALSSVNATSSSPAFNNNNSKPTLTFNNNDNHDNSNTVILKRELSQENSYTAQLLESIIKARRSDPSPESGAECLGSLKAGSHSVDLDDSVGNDLLLIGSSVTVVTSSSSSSSSSTASTTIAADSMISQQDALQFASANMILVSQQNSKANSTSALTQSIAPGNQSRAITNVNYCLTKLESDEPKLSAIAEVRKDIESSRQDEKMGANDINVDKINGVSSSIVRFTPTMTPAQTFSSSANLMSRTVHGHYATMNRLNNYFMNRHPLGNSANGSGNGAGATIEFQCLDCDQLIDVDQATMLNKTQALRLLRESESYLESISSNNISRHNDNTKEKPLTPDQLDRAYIAAMNGLPLCKLCEKKRIERKEIISEFVETELKYGRDLKIIHDEFYRPMQVAGLLSKDHINGVFSNLDELIMAHCKFAARLEYAIGDAHSVGDSDYNTVNIGKLFVESAEMLHAFESYCIRQGSAACLLARLAKEKELLRIFLRVSQMENTLLRRMNLAAFLMVPVQRVTRYPLLLNRLYKVTAYHHKDREALRDAQLKVELHLEHINLQTKGVGSSNKIWRRISNLSAPNSNRRSLINAEDIGYIKLRKTAMDMLKWNRDETQFIHSGRLNFAPLNEFLIKQKMKPLRYMASHALLVVLGRPNWKYRPDLVKSSLDSKLMTPTPGGNGIEEAALLLFREKNGRFVPCREPLLLSNCILSNDCSQFNSECPTVNQGSQSNHHGSSSSSSKIAATSTGGQPSGGTTQGANSIGCNLGTGANNSGSRGKLSTQSSGCDRRDSGSHSEPRMTIIETLGGNTMQQQHQHHQAIDTGPSKSLNLRSSIELSHQHQQQQLSSNSNNSNIEYRSNSINSDAVSMSSLRSLPEEGNGMSTASSTSSSPPPQQHTARSYSLASALPRSAVIAGPIQAAASSSSSSTLSAAAVASPATAAASAPTAHNETTHYNYYFHNHHQSPYGDYEESFEIHERLSKESMFLRADTALKTRYWFQMLRYHAKDLGQWRSRRNGLANIMMMRQE